MTDEQIAQMANHVGATALVYDDVDGAILSLVTGAITIAVIAGMSRAELNEVIQAGLDGADGALAMRADAQKRIDDEAVLS